MADDDPGATPNSRSSAPRPMPSACTPIKLRSAPNSQRASYSRKPVDLMRRLFIFECIRAQIRDGLGKHQWSSLGERRLGRQRQPVAASSLIAVIVQKCRISLGRDGREHLGFGPIKLLDWVRRRDSQLPKGSANDSRPFLADLRPVCEDCAAPPH